MKKKPIVSVITVAYNHEDFIAECIESVVNQKCDFKFEMIIGEDCSTDDTRKIIKKYEKKYPDIIKPIYNKENLKGRKNWLNALRQAGGKYIAHLDGDDLMLFGKLQKQVDFMEKNTDFVMVGHNVEVIEGSGKVLNKSYNINTKKVGTVDDLILDGTYMTHSSIMYRSKFVDIDLFDKMHKYRYGDWLMQIIVARNGKIGFIDEVLGSYRKHESGITSKFYTCIESRNYALKAQLNILNSLEKLNQNQYNIDIRRSKILLAYALDMLRFKEYNLFQEYINKSMKIHKLKGLQFNLVYSLRFFPKLLKILWIIRG